MFMGMVVKSFIHKTIYVSSFSFTLCLLLTFLTLRAYPSVYKSMIYTRIRRGTGKTNGIFSETQDEYYTIINMYSDTRKHPDFEDSYL